MTKPCREYEAQWEDVLNGSAELAVAEKLAAHRESCAACREAFETARLATRLLRAGLTPAAEPGGLFATGVMAAIRTEESKRLAAGEFWRPLEALASRLALTAATALLMLGVYLYEFAPPRYQEPVASERTLIGEAFPDPAASPANTDELLLTLAEDGYGR
ncbi:MAG TPA: hypothetical protein VHM88_10165 [Candidatus Acidoferrales bacterium]|jgi:hypothetical protein|nr:hypothetical protein [Candidatus Acidoferrales bacterium]